MTKRTTASALVFRVMKAIGLPLNLNKNVTPQELLKTLKDRNIIGELKTIKMESKNE